MWNYGSIPQTWEDPEYIDPNTGVGGDNDPVDILEVRSTVLLLVVLLVELVTE